MTSKRSIIIFWALFLVPTLIMAIIAFKLLSHEQDRISQSALHALSERAKTISETIHLTVEAVQENLTQSLLVIDQDDLKKNLIKWEETNPLVRNVFVYKKDQNLEYPIRGLESTPEERLFIARYDSLFSGRIKFDFNEDPLRDESKIKGAEDSYSGSSRYDSAPTKQIESSRQKLVALSRVAQKAPALEQQAIFLEAKDQEFLEKSGWIPWFSENSLYILGWVQKFKDGPVYGVELEIMTLLSRLVVDFPELSEKGTALVLVDGNGNFMHQSGTWVTDPEDKPVAVIFISSLLPHWQIAVFVDDKGFGASRGFLYVSVILLGIFIAAIISGGLLLTRLTLKNMKDARQKTSFVSSVSHELKTPLTSIRMYAELLLLKRIKDENKTQTYLSVIVNESGRLTRLINNVLDFGKLEQGKKTYQMTGFEMDRFLLQMICAHSIRIENQGLEIITQVEEGEYHVRTDKDAIEQVVLNLLDNALKYAGQGKFIKFVLKKEDTFILLKICDDGPGIPSAQQKMIFEKFHRVDNSLTSKQPGSGLGLSIARQILRDLKGDLFFEPVPGNGSCFTARIKHHDSD
ncbi:MAG: HAMP domain-containing histidine kinase [Deltaproteobacteria bacterium]|uniref:sensor histidine kinase n=1 Tax=Desulfobacula sp. TaxID=2593537 RepID=UPI00199BEEA3|nr:HAMP domain-containing histidine kinase [Candidatus Desulfobacula maris]MBL6992526.1 HAMP domain-containing histidine kinase [Desulfobacula sp.]